MYAYIGRCINSYQLILGLLYSMMVLALHDAIIPGQAITCTGLDIVSFESSPSI